MAQKHLAIIQESECIGCTKCIDVCPTDAILGADRLMHTVLATECIGCQLCVPACPVDCILLIAPTENFIPLKKEEIQSRIKNRKSRLVKIENPRIFSDSLLGDRKEYIKAALLRAKQKSVSK